jgi:2,3-bisphosphoglycerate-independent phosphoglycerate mutase
MKIILILLDGLGDRSYEVLNHRTPLQSAATPNLDRFASLGGNGLFHAGLPGQCLPSELAHYLIFGYDATDFPGRGLLAAVGEDITFQDRDVLCLARLLSVQWDRQMPIMTHKVREMGVDPAEMVLLYAALTPYETRGIWCTLHRTHPNNGVLILSGPVSPHISDADPMGVGRPVARVLPLRSAPEPGRAKETALAVNTYLSHCHRLLSAHPVNNRRAAENLPPANFLATQRCGRRVPQEAFAHRWGMAGMVIASGSVYGGLAHELGMSFLKVEDGADPGDDLRDRIRAALSNTDHDFIHVHTKAPDDAAHTGDPLAKQEAIQALDRGLTELLETVSKRDDLVVCITSDHSTPSVSRLIHSGEPVPLAIVGPSIRRDSVTRFDEVSAGTGCLGLLRGRELMLTLLNFADRSALSGHRLGHVQRPYDPRAYEPFRMTEET